MHSCDVAHGDGGQAKGVEEQARDSPVRRVELKVTDLARTA
jgi:hypothetical protein